MATYTIASDQDYPFRIANEVDYTDYLFQIANSGTTQLKGTLAVTGTISGATVSGGSLSIGASFSVSTSGVLNASGATVSGAITATSGSITGTLTVSGTLNVTGKISAPTADSGTGWRVVLGDSTYPLRYWNGTDTGLTMDNSGAIAVTVRSNTAPALRLSNVNNKSGNQLEWTFNDGTTASYIDKFGSIYHGGGTFTLSTNLANPYGASALTTDIGGGFVTTQGLSLYNAMNDGTPAIWITPSGGAIGGDISVPSIEFGNPGASRDINLYRSSAGTMRSNAHWVFDDSIEVLSNAGAITDGLFAHPPGNGTIALDTTNHRLYYRRGGAWHYVQETA